MTANERAPLSGNARLNGASAVADARALRVLSLGAGVQSTTVMLMAVHGELEPFDCAIFADTGWEPPEVYEHLAKLEAEAERTYKIEPVEKKLRELLGLTPGQRWPLDHRIDQFFGISWDESTRMRDSLRPAIQNHYPLVDRRMTRDDCHRWLADNGWTAPRSACIGCPYHRNDEWRRLRDDDPASFADAIAFDTEIRRRQAADMLPIEGVPYLHDSRVPLGEVDFDIPDDGQLSLFEDECEGMCGL